MIILKRTCSYAVLYLQAREDVSLSCRFFFFFFFVKVRFLVTED